MVGEQFEIRIRLILRPQSFGEAGDGLIRDGEQPLGIGNVKLSLPRPCPWAIKVQTGEGGLEYLWNHLVAPARLFAVATVAAELCMVVEIWLKVVYSFPPMQKHEY